MTRHSRHAAQREAQRMMKASRELNRSAILLALSVLADSGVEHYRGSFRNRAMLAPLAASALSLAAGPYDLGIVAGDNRHSWLALGAG
ncbi:hypothetical protein ACN4GS_23560, partial [Burkholderia pseudomallei]